MLPMTPPATAPTTAPAVLALLPPPTSLPATPPRTAPVAVPTVEPVCEPSITMAREATTRPSSTRATVPTALRSYEFAPRPEAHPARASASAANAAANGLDGFMVAGVEYCEIDVVIMQLLQDGSWGEPVPTH